MTNEKARVVYKYYGCKYEYNVPGTIGDEIFTGTVSEVDIELARHLNSPKFRLHLKNLSSISDAHAIEVAKMLCEQADVEYSIEGRNEEAIFVKAGEGLIVGIYFMGGFVMANYYHQDEYAPALFAHQAADYLRSQSYDLDGLIEKGCAVKKEVGNE